jgi:hypothetical protein
LVILIATSELLMSIHCDRPAGAAKRARALVDRGHRGSGAGEVSVK